MKFLLDNVPFTALYRINNGTLPLGALVAENCAAIQQDVRSIYFDDHLMKSFFSEFFRSNEIWLHRIAMVLELYHQHSLAV